MQKKIQEMLKERKYVEFPTVLMKCLGYGENYDASENMREDAYKTFCGRLNGRFPASIPTMKKWFGIGGVSIPKREQIYELCFYLNLTVEEAEVLFTAGIKEPSFQINDYHETIYLYGLENSLEFDVCQELIEKYELALREDIVICHTHTTHELKRQFLYKKSLAPQQFLEWMLDNQVFFKGYSKSTLDYLLHYRKLIVNHIREDSAICLNSLLNETGYAAWKKRRLRREKEEESIRKYIYSTRNLDESLRKSILELVQIVYSETEQNALVIRELFSEQVGNKWKQKISHSINFRMTEKRLSDLLHVGIQKERQIRVTQAYSVLADLEDASECLDWIRKLILEYSANESDVQTVKEAKEWLLLYKKEHKRRSLLIQRSDLLPLILYVVQNHYLDTIGYDMNLYKREEATKEFTEVANSTLAACNMALLDEKYVLDDILFQCFQDKGMYSYAEMMDLIQKYME